LKEELTWKIEKVGNRFGELGIWGMIKGLVVIKEEKEG